jgi:hypothetical protein
MNECRSRGNYYILLPPKPSMGRPKNGIDKRCPQCNKQFYVPKSKSGQVCCSQECAKRNREPPWNKGLTKDDDPRLASVSRKSREQMKREYASGQRDPRKITEAAHEAVRRKSREAYEAGVINRRVSKRGYVMRYVPMSGWVNEHRWVYEQARGPIPDGMHVHHKDGDRFNNAIENLDLVSPSDHARLHDNHRCAETGRFVQGD